MQETSLVKIPKGEDAYLSPDEAAAVQRLMRYPEVLPEEFWRAVYQKVALNGEPISQSQVQGLSQLTARYATVLTTDEVTSTSYTDATNVGPTIEGLSNGTYLLLFGYRLGAASNLTDSFMSPSVNGSTPSDNDAATARTVQTAVARGVLKEIDGDNNNTVKMQYKRTGGTDGDFEYRWLVALKIGN